MQNQVFEFAWAKPPGTSDRVQQEQSFGCPPHNQTRLIGDVLSVSAAFLSESEEVIGKNRVYEYVDYGDSLGLYTLSDHPNIKPSVYSRISIRPKIKLPLGDNFYFQSEYKELIVIE